MGGRRLHRLLAAASPLLAACAGDAPPRPADPGAASMPTAFADSLPACAAPGIEAFAIDTVATGLEVPWDLVFLPDGRILFTERPGRIRVIRDGRLQPEPWAALEVFSGGEAGLMGIDIEPRFEANGHLFVSAAVLRGNRWRARAANAVRRIFRRPTVHAITTRVIRFTDVDGRATEQIPVVVGIPASVIHAGGALRFGHDGRLYMGTGDGGVPSLAGDRASRAGAILALTPWEQTVLAKGLRNVQGLDWSPADGRLRAIDHGPTGMLREGRRTGHDELNAIESGADYGWPVEAGRVESPMYRPPVLEWTEAIAPAGMAFWKGDLFVAALAARDLIRVRFDGAGTPSCTQRLFDGSHGRIRALRAGPDGALWVGTSNRDGRGSPGPADDLLLRLVPAADTP